MSSIEKYVAELVNDFFATTNVTDPKNVTNELFNFIEYNSSIKFDGLEVSVSKTQSGYKGKISAPCFVQPLSFEFN